MSRRDTGHEKPHFRGLSVLVEGILAQLAKDRADAAERVALAARRNAEQQAEIAERLARFRADYDRDWLRANSSLRR